VLIKLLGLLDRLLSLIFKDHVIGISSGVFVKMNVITAPTFDTTVLTYKKVLSNNRGGIYCSIGSVWTLKWINKQCSVFIDNLLHRLDCICITFCYYMYFTLWWLYHVHYGLSDYLLCNLMILDYFNVKFYHSFSLENKLICIFWLIYSSSLLF
jgi:hypothetical protein